MWIFSFWDHLSDAPFNADDSSATDYSDNKENSLSDNTKQENLEKPNEENDVVNNDVSDRDSLNEGSNDRNKQPNTDAIDNETDESLLSRILGGKEKQEITSDKNDDKLDYSDQISRIKDSVGENEYKEHQGFYDNLAKLDVTPEYRDKLTDCYKDMDPDLKDVYNDYSDKLKCLDTKYNGTAHYSPGDGGFYFNEQKDIAKGLGEGNTYFHESAHMIDDLSGNSSYANNMTDAIQADYDDAISNIMKNENCTVEQAQEKLSNELWNNPNESNCVSDVFGGLTGNKVSGPWGHRAEYWANRDRSAIGKEAFAEITADSACNANNLAYTQKYMPKTYNAYKSIIGLIKGGK